jgi:hypothetical protein
MLFKIKPKKKHVRNAPLTKKAEFSALLRLCVNLFSPVP